MDTKKKPKGIPIDSQVIAQAPQIPFAMPGMVRPREAEPIPIERAAIQYQMDQGPMQDFNPAKPIRGTVSSPGIVQTPGERQAAIDAMDQYDLNTGRVEDIKARHQALADAEKADVYAEHYQAGEIPELDARMGSMGSYTMLKDDQGRIIGAWNAKTGRLEPPPIQGARTGAISEDQRQGVAARGVTMGKLMKLGELAKKHEKELGPYADRINRFRMSGLGSPLGLENANPEVIDMYATINDLQNARIYEQSGKAINREEFERLKRVMPRTDEDAATFWVKYKNFLRELQDKRYKLGEEQPQAPQATAAPIGGMSMDSTSTPPAEKKRIRL